MAILDGIFSDLGDIFESLCDKPPARVVLHSNLRLRDYQSGTLS
jgi:hypothetical protein